MLTLGTYQSIQLDPGDRETLEQAVHLQSWDGNREDRSFYFTLSQRAGTLESLCRAFQESDLDSVYALSTTESGDTLEANAYKLDSNGNLQHAFCLFPRDAKSEPVEWDEGEHIPPDLKLYAQERIRMWHYDHMASESIKELSSR